MQDEISRINNICLVILTLIASTAALIYTKNIMIPLVFAIFLYSVVSSGIRYFRKKYKLSKRSAVLVTLALALGSTAFSVFFTVISIQNFVQSSHEYQAKILAFVDWATQIADKFGYAFNAQNIKTELTQLPLFDIAQTLTGGIFTFLGNLVLVLVLTLFLGVGSRTAEHNALLSQIQSNVSKYIFIKWLSSLTGGTLIWLILIICKVQLAFMLAILAFLLNFIPSIGAVVATLLPLPIILLQYGFGWQFTVVLAFISLVQFSIGSFVEPKLIGNSVNLHPITVLVSLLFWGLVWGIPGMFLSVPITAAFRIIFSKIEPTRPIADLLSGKI